MRLIVPGLAAFCAAFVTQAGAQTVVTRSITTEPVETVVTQTPTGTIVTRRPVANAPIAGTVVEDDTIDATVTRQAVQRGVQPARELVTRDVAARPQRRATKTTRVKQSRAVTRTVAPTRTLVLNPSERRIVYQTIVEREVRPQVVPQQVVVAPPVVQTVPVAPQIVQTVPAAPRIVAQEEVVVQPRAPIYTVGSVLPMDTPLYAIPQEVALRVPATQAYSYAYLGGRAYLVDAPTGTVVADVTD